MGDGPGNRLVGKATGAGDRGRGNGWGSGSGSGVGIWGRWRGEPGLLGDMGLRRPSGCGVEIGCRDDDQPDALDKGCVRRRGRATDSTGGGLRQDVL
jgi:hypothetical protein